MYHYGIAYRAINQTRSIEDAKHAKRASGGSNTDKTKTDPLQTIKRITPVVNPPPYRTLTFWQQSSLAAGAATTAFGLPATLIPIESSPHFSWTTNTISSLLNGPQGTLLSAGLIGSGVLAASFSYGFRESLPRSRIYDFGAWGLVVGGAALSAAGVIHPPSILHEPLAATYFVATPASMATMGGAMISQGAKISGGLTVAAAGTVVAAGGLGFIPAPHHITAVYEFIASSAIGTWVFVSSVYALFKNRLVNGSDSVDNKKAA